MSVSLLRGNLKELDKFSFTKSQPACTANKLTYVNRKCNVNVVNSCITYVKVYMNMLMMIQATLDIRDVVLTFDIRKSKSTVVLEMLKKLTDV